MISRGPFQPKWIYETQAWGVRSSGAAYLSQQKDVLREHDWAESMSKSYWHLHSENQVRGRHGVLLRGDWIAYTKHDPNSEVPWWVLISCSLSLYDSSLLEWDIFENLSCIIASERKGRACDAAWSATSIICLHDLLLPLNLYFIVVNWLGFVYLW